MSEVKEKSLEEQIGQLKNKKESLKKQLQEVENEITILEHKKDSIKGLEIINKMIEEAKKDPKVKFLFHPQPYLAGDHRLEDLFEYEDEEEHEKKEEEEVEEVEEEDTMTDEEKKEEQEREKRSEERKLIRELKEKEKQEKLHKENPIIPLIDTHFKVDIIEIPYKVGTSGYTSVYLHDYDGEWEIDHEDFNNKEEINLSFYEKLYEAGDTFDENIREMEHNGDHKEGRGEGKIYVEALMLTLRKNLIV